MRTLTATWEALSPTSPNYRRPLENTAVHRFTPGTAAMRALLRQLCEAGAR